MIRIKFINDEVKDAGWLILKQMGALFGRNDKAIGKHIRNTYKETKLDKSSTLTNFALMAEEK